MTFTPYNQPEKDPESYRRLKRPTVKKICVALEKYIDEHDPPELQEFVVTEPLCAKYQVRDDQLINKFHYPEFDYLVYKLLKKQERYYRKKGMGGQGTAMSIFLLKQREHGYSDRFQTDLTSDGKELTFHNFVPRATTERKPRINERMKRLQALENPPTKKLGGSGGRAGRRGRP